MFEDKKGLFKTTTEIIVAVICIAFLLFSAGKLLGIYGSESETEQAEATLDSLINNLEALEEGEETEFILASPNDWYLFYFDPDDDISFDGIDRDSSGRSLCICPVDELNYPDPSLGGMPSNSDEVDYINPRCDEGICEENVAPMKLSLEDPVNFPGIKIDIKELYISKGEEYAYLGPEDETIEDVRSYFGEFLSYSVSEEVTIRESIIDFIYDDISYDETTSRIDTAFNDLGLEGRVKIINEHGNTRLSYLSFSNTDDEKRAQLLNSNEQTREIEFHDVEFNAFRE